MEDKLNVWLWCWWSPLPKLWNWWFLGQGFRTLVEPTWPYNEIVLVNRVIKSYSTNRLFAWYLLELTKLLHFLKEMQCNPYFSETIRNPDFGTLLMHWVHLEGPPNYSYRSKHLQLLTYSTQRHWTTWLGSVYLWKTLMLPPLETSAK